VANEDEPTNPGGPAAKRISSGNLPAVLQPAPILKPKVVLGVKMAPVSPEVDAAHPPMNRKLDPREDKTWQGQQPPPLVSDSMRPSSAGFTEQQLRWARVVEADSRDAKQRAHRSELEAREAKLEAREAKLAAQELASREERHAAANETQHVELGKKIDAAGDKTARANKLIALAIAVLARSVVGSCSKASGYRSTRLANRRRLTVT